MMADLTALAQRSQMNDGASEMSDRYIAAASFSDEARLDMAGKLMPWINQFCLYHGFVDRTAGRVKVARALNLLTYGNPRTREEDCFLYSLCGELEQRFPGGAYPAHCVRFSKVSSKSGLAQWRASHG